MESEKFINEGLARLLKEVGYDRPVLSYFRKIQNEQMRVYQCRNHWEKCIAADMYPRPTLDEVVSWLREKYHIFIEIGVSLTAHQSYVYSVRVLSPEVKTLYLAPSFCSYEKACLSGIEIAILYILYYF